MKQKLQKGLRPELLNPYKLKQQREIRRLNYLPVTQEEVIKKFEKDLSFTFVRILYKAQQNLGGAEGEYYFSKPIWDAIGGFPIDSDFEMFDGLTGIIKARFFSLKELE